MKVKATVHGAISLVNAIATGKGATLGISTKAESIVDITSGTGITLTSNNRTISSRLVDNVVKKIISKNELGKNKIKINIETNIPVGYGLKSSSAISTSVALACSKIFKPKMSDLDILLTSVNASIETKVSLTGAYDDACACYYGGFNVTDNYKRKIILRKIAPKNIDAIIFIPNKRKRGNVKNLKNFTLIFEEAWNLAKNSDFWNAMILNGFTTATILKSEPKIVSDMIKNGALGASVTGNGPAFAVVANSKITRKIKKSLSELDGSVMVSKINNEKATVYDL